jgi:hypothetical protein
MNKLSLDYQSRFKGKLLYDNEFLKSGAIDPDVQVHDEAERHPLSSAGSCINVLGSLTFKPIELTNFLNSFGLNINQVIKFPTGANIGGRVYQDKGYVIFEWVGPLSSPINEVGGKRGSRRTSIDAYVLAEIEGKLTQLLIEWKFTEGLSRPLELERFSGLQY